MPFQPLIKVLIDWLIEIRHMHELIQFSNHTSDKPYKSFLYEVLIKVLNVISSTLDFFTYFCSGKDYSMNINGHKYVHVSNFSSFYTLRRTVQEDLVYKLHILLIIKIKTKV